MIAGLLWFSYHVINYPRGTPFQEAEVLYGAFLSTIVAVISSILVIWNRLHVQIENEKIVDKLDKIIAIYESISGGGLYKDQQSSHHHTR